MSCTCTSMACQFEPETVLNQIDKQIMMCLFFPRLAFERALTLDPLCTGAMTGLAILELNSKKVSMPH